MNGLVGAGISCYIYSHGVYLKDFESYLPSADNPIIVQIYGIINPNFYEGFTTDYIKIAVLK